MLMDLEKIRKSEWKSKLGFYLEKYKDKLRWGDQDLLNILFHYHPGW